MRVTTRLARVGSTVGMAAVASLLLASCSEGAGAAEQDLAPVPDQVFVVEVDDALTEQLPAELRDSGAVSIAVSVGSAPDDFHDENGKLVGWEVDLARAAFDKLGLTPEFHEISFDSIIPGLKGERYDIAFGQIGITGERMEVMDQVGTALTNQGIAAPAESDIKIESLDDLCGLSVGVNRGSRQQDFALEQSDKCVADGGKTVDLQVYEDGNKTNMAMLSGRTDVSWNGATSINYFVAVSNGKAKLVGEYLEPYPMGAALPKASPLSQPFADAVNQLLDDGTYDAIMAKWGLEGNAIPEATVNPELESE
ncbi:ABC transporter substrate-binding protein [Leucobacter sp. HY1910]